MKSSIYFAIMILSSISSVSGQGVTQWPQLNRQLALLLQPEGDQDIDFSKNAFFAEKRTPAAAELLLLEASLLGRYPLIQQATFKYYLDEQVVPRKTKLIACLNILQTHSGPEIGFSCATQLEYLRASEQERFFCEILRGFLARSTNWRRNIEILENLKVASLEELVVESGGLTASSLSAVVFLISDLTNELGKGGKAAYMRALNAIAMVPGNPRAVYLLLSAEVTKKPEVVKELADLEKDADIDESLRAAIKLKLVKSLDDK